MQGETEDGGSRYAAIPGNHRGTLEGHELRLTENPPRDCLNARRKDDPTGGDRFLQFDHA